MARILYLAPLRVDAPRATDATADALRPGNSLTRLSFTRGPRHLEYHYYETLVLPDLLHTLVEAERQGNNVVYSLRHPKVIDAIDILRGVMSDELGRQTALRAPVVR